LAHRARERIQDEILLSMRFVKPGRGFGRDEL
jgi:hypothetical protein